MDKPQPKSFDWSLLAIVVVIVAGSLWIGGLLPGRPLSTSAIGQPLPSLATVGAWVNTGAPPTDASLRGQWVVLDFWATWCAPCRQEFPALIPVVQQFEAQGVQFIGVGWHSTQEAAEVQSFVAETAGFNWPVAVGADDINGALGISQIPTFLLFDPTGKCVWSGHAATQLGDELRARLAAGNPPAAP